ncbi:MAG: Rieske (2Fe-2S) protein [Bacteroidetes bacterium]|nr:Rieske (2Fe-2S) protein [Bacteroidota bacterium]MBI3482402.1 Rieske (2Fe-2S) protein [Bacteroidota bacterium]
MNRREFISNTCIACASGAGLSYLLSSCSSTHYVTGTLEQKGISIAVSEFTYLQKGKPVNRDFIIVHHDNLEFPIYLSRIKENEYSALWMKCSHQGSELNAGGDYLYCSSHGSEFDRKGNAIHGPAEKNLRSFPTSILNNKVLIELTKG